MRFEPPSPSAYRVALRRAAHQRFDWPLVFEDPLALPILGLHTSELRAPARPSSRALRAYLVARARFVEDSLHRSVLHGATQYILLGAGLDTFAYRNPYPSLEVVEVDNAAMQAWKRGRLRQAGIPEPANLSFCAIDLGRADLLQALTQATPIRAEPFVTAMGLIPYLTTAAFGRVLLSVQACGAGTQFICDYRLPAAALAPDEQKQLQSLSARVAAAGEPFLQLLSPEQVHTELARHRFTVVADLGTDDLNRGYFSERTDGLAILGDGNRIAVASIASSRECHPFFPGAGLENKAQQTSQQTQP